MKLRIIFSATMVLFVSAPNVYAQQQITILWASKQSQNAPITVDQATPVHIVVTRVNDALYTYEGYITAVPQAVPDVLTSLLPAATAAKAMSQQCSDAGDLLTAIAKDMTSWQLNPWVDQTGKAITGTGAPNSVSIETTSQFYTTNISLKFAQVSQTVAHTCGLDTPWANINSFTQDWAQRLARPHTYTIDQTLTPMNDYTIHLIEYAYDPTHNLQMTNACTQSGKPAECTIKYSPQNNLLSVSGGFLFSQLQSRSYVRANVPGQTGAVLQVNGTGPVNSLLTSLVNVKIPCFWAKGTGFASHIPPCSPNTDVWGWALSVGPALQLGTNDQTSRVGLFTGISLHFWKYLYITPGFHIGQFADFPPGFTQGGQQIPPTFTGALTPQTRSTARFGISLTFKGFNIPTGSSKSPGQTTSQNNTK